MAVNSEMVGSTQNDNANQQPNECDLAKEWNVGSWKQNVSRLEKQNVA